jgi:hypothetical protein
MRQEWTESEMQSVRIVVGLALSDDRLRLGCIDANKQCSFVLAAAQ